MTTNTSGGTMRATTRAITQLSKDKNMKMNLTGSTDLTNSLKNTCSATAKLDKLKAKYQMQVNQLQNKSSGPIK